MLNANKQMCIHAPFECNSGQSGLKNERPGGETVQKSSDLGMEGPYFVYFVHRSFKRESNACLMKQ